MLATILLIIVLAIVAVLVLAAAQPDTFYVSRTQTIKAPPETIFPFINDLHKWQAWSPYEKLDPNMKKTHSGAADGKGACYAWQGNAKVGAGRIEITESVPCSKVTMLLHMLKPMEGRNTVNFTLVPNGAGTDVTWAMKGTCGFMAKVVHLFCSMDKMIGGQFSEGLANLKSISEK